MGSIVSRTLSIGQEHELLQKLETVGLSEEDAQKVIDCRGNQLARDIIALIRSGIHQPAEIFNLPVNYDDLAWQTIDRSRYMFVGDVTVNDYPVTETGTKSVRFRLFDFDHESSDQEVLTLATQLNCRQPNRAEAETVIRRYTSEQLREHPVMGLVGSGVRCDGKPSRAYVCGYGHGVDIGWGWTDDHWDQNYLFVFVCR
jgi:hypothetical protein